MKARSIVANLVIFVCWFVHLCKIKTTATSRVKAAPTCEDIVLASNTSKQVIKSLSTYRDQVVLLYGDQNETQSVFLYHFRPEHAINKTDNPLFGLKLDKGQLLNHDLLVNVLPGLDWYIDKYEIVSLLYYNDQIVLCFFRDVPNGKTIFVTHNKKAVMHWGPVYNVAHVESHSILLHHFTDNIISNNSLAYFITLDDQSYQEGAVVVTSDDKIELIPNMSRLMGIDSRLSNKLYLLTDRSEATRNLNFVPLYTQLQLQNWRALRHYDYIYILSGHKSGSVFYFKPTPLAEYGANTSLEQAMGRMEYVHFFDCFGDNPGIAPPTFPPYIVRAHYVGMTFFYILVILIGLLILLCIIYRSCYTPARKRMIRLCRPKCHANHDCETCKNLNQTSEAKTQDTTTNTNTTPPHEVKSC